MDTREHTYLFEVSWEVCNKVGGICTVLESKARTAQRVFGDNYFMLGPDLKTNPEFEETDEPVWEKIREGLAIKEIPCRFGRWKIPGRPKTILVSASRKYSKDQILYHLWEGFGVDSISGQWDYVEPVMFSHACGEAIETIYNLLIRQDGGEAVAQFHEWLCGAGLLHLKKSLPEIATVFTTHATVLGRTLAGSGMDIYSEMENISPQREAATQNIAAKYSMESAAARSADAFTTVSEITASEARSFLGRSPDVILPNGLDMESIPDLTENRAPAMESRRHLLDFASRFLGRELPAQTAILMISGRYEFHNKGIDSFLFALQRLEKSLDANQRVLVYLCILAGHKEVLPAALGRDDPHRGASAPSIVTHRLDYEASDAIIAACNNLGLRNGPDNRVCVVFVPAFLNGYDGALNMPYYNVLSGSDLAVFPSYYEPWGYTPLEGAAYAVPTVTTDQAGFGLWVRGVAGDNNGVILLNRKRKDMSAITEDLFRILQNALSWSDAERDQRRKSARQLAMKARWDDFYKCYLQAYDFAAEVCRKRAAQLKLSPARQDVRLTFTGIGSMQPHFRVLTAEVNLPKPIGRLRELAFNLWCTWHPQAMSLFAHLDPGLWETLEHNPVRLLDSVAPARLEEMAANEAYAGLYTQVMSQFDDDTKEKPAEGVGKIRWAAPVAYFSTEYGLHDMLPIYSGGLGVLSGDHLKAASDLNIPLVGVGLFYKNGYFRQRVDKDGWQIAEYPELDFAAMPAQIVRDERGIEVQVEIDLPGRVLNANIWEIKVGRISLYLLDTDTHRNTAQDRKVTSRLYPGDRRVRIEQEILLGMGGVRLLKKLGIKPSVYHINEGHSAFMIFERIAILMSEAGLSFDEAKEIVQAGTVFTTHTPVEAGHERFTKDIIEYYFSNYIQRVGVTWSQFWEMGRKESGDDKPFFMTMLGLKASLMRNAVSRKHERVSRHMWRDAWKGFDQTDVPIGHVTNGVHVPSFVDPRMNEILNAHLGLDWARKIDRADVWKRVQDIPDALFWHVRCELKQKLRDFLRDDVCRHWQKYGDSRISCEEALARINPSSLLIGFARRFAPYKRADLLLTDLDRLNRLVNHEARPVQVVFAGKAHPDDRAGIELMQKVIRVCQDQRFRGRILFIEDYNLRTARHLVRGVDLWLNTPLRPYEASGTSGQKAVVNGALNLSVYDGWWCEAYDGHNGWTVGPVTESISEDAEDASADDAKSLYSTLEDVIVPMFYDRDNSGVPRAWVRTAKHAMATIIPMFNTNRMMRQYVDELYVPASERGYLVQQGNFKLAREIADWKRKIPTRFSSVRVIDVSIQAARGNAVVVGQPFTVVVRIEPGKLENGEIRVELVVGKIDRSEFTGMPECIRLEPAGGKSNGMQTFTGDYLARENGRYSYGVRVLPYNANLAWKQDAELVLWG